MTEQVFLAGIKLSQFRSFGELDIKLPTEPGVLIVYGSNGLGKSSLFDGLEWALTDRIDHFREARGADKVGKYLSRWRDNPTGRTSVAMTFSDGAVVERSIASASSTESILGGSVSNITSYLRTEQWTQTITHLNSYLLLTHFLGQSTLSRLTHRNASERFDILKEAAQSSELEAIATALHGRGNTAMVRAFSRINQNLEKDAERFSELLDHEAKLWLATDGSGAIDNVQAHRLVQQIVTLVGARTADLFYDLARDAGPGGPDVAKIRRALEAALTRLRERQEQLSLATHMIETSQRLAAEVAAVKSALVETAGQLVQLDGEVTTNIGIRDRLRRNHDDAMLVLAAARTHRDQLIELREARAASEKLHIDRRATEIELAEAETKNADAVHRAENVERLASISRRLEKEISHLDAELQRQRAEVQIFEQWIQRDRANAEQRDALARIEMAHPNIESEIADAESIARNAADAASSQARALGELRKAFGSISNAVALIAANLPENVDDCPVCATHFADTNLLRTRATTAAERIAPVLFAQEESLAALSRHRDVVARRLGLLLESREQIRLQRTELAASQRRNAELFETIRHLQVLGERVDQALVRLTDGIEKTRKRRERKLYWIHRLEPKDGLSLLAQISRATQQRDDTRAERNRLAQTLSNLLTAIAVIAAKLSSLEAQPSVTADLHEQLDVADRAYEDAVLKAEASRKSLDVIASRINSLTAEQAAARARQGQLNNQQSNYERERREVLARWGKLEFGTSEPSEKIIDPIARELAAKERDILSAEDLLSQIVAGRVAWAHQLTHRDALETLRAAVDGAPNSGREELRQAAERLRDSRMAAAAATRATKQIAQDASHELLTELDGFNAEFIRPLDNLMKQINQAILTDPRVGIGLQVNKKKIEQNAVKVGEVPDGVGNIDPVLVHSEGQMSALAVSMLCAASLTFPWSRWRALVLDDPLQHNDGIHTAAFADLMGNLVSRRGYQILLSTHDIAQAEFLQRKFAARQIPCATLSLLGTGREGVETSFIPAMVL